MTSRAPKRTETMQTPDQLIPELHTDTTDPLHDSPGRQFRVARETAEISLAQVAAELHLSTQTIAALEDDHYEDLPSEVFILGYMRAYARLLGLNPAPLLERYRLLQSQHLPAKPAPAEKAPPSQRSLISLPLLALISILLLAGALWLLWTNLDVGAIFGPPPESEATEDAPQRPVFRAPQPVRPRPPEEAPAAAPNGETPPDQTRLDTPGSDDDAPSPATPVTEPTSSDQSTPDEPSAEADDDQGTQGAALAASEAEAEAAPEAAPTGRTAASGPPEVRLAFSGPCWVDVRDSTGEIQLFGEMSKGDRRLLSGRPPYSLLLGNASVVELTVNGQPVDVQSRARGNVARFDLDPSRL